MTDPDPAAVAGSGPAVAAHVPDRHAYPTTIGADP